LGEETCPRAPEDEIVLMLLTINSMTGLTVSKY
jgi:hypothetical protein